MLDAGLEVALDLAEAQVVELGPLDRQLGHVPARVVRELAAADRLAERHRQARARVVDRLGAELAVVDQLGHLGEPAAHAVLVDRREPQLAEPRQQPLAALRRVVLQRAGGDVRALGLEHAAPRTRRTSRATRAPRRGGPPRSAARRAATAAPRLVEAAARRQRAVGLAEHEPPARAGRGLVRVDAAAGRRRALRAARRPRARVSAGGERSERLGSAPRLVGEPPRALRPSSRQRTTPALAGSVEVHAHGVPPGWGTAGEQGCSPVVRGVAARCSPPDRSRSPRTRKAPPSGAFRSAPKRTRTSTRLSRTRPSTWRVYQFRHRREGDGEYSPASACRLSPSTRGSTFTNTCSLHSINPP